MEFSSESNVNSTNLRDSTLIGISNNQLLIGVVLDKIFTVTIFSIPESWTIFGG
ncbi:MAG: hypothetical protein HN794_05555 [Euryarchaeota archaeon]|nr:hypothetical protein [Euryarchaeota archaeon]